VDQPSIGFIGGGRAATIILVGMDRSGRRPPQVVVSDPSETALEKLGRHVPGVLVTSDNGAAASQDVVFLAVHPPVIREIAGQVALHLRPDATVVSLAPKLTLGQLVALLGGFERVARVIPNAPSIVGVGYNPISFGSGLDAAGRRIVLDVLGSLGECPEVPEANLEAYAVLTAMGPTYLWFQLYELLDLAESFGLTREEAQHSQERMVSGALATMRQSGLSAAEVMDLVAVRPFGEAEPTIRELYRSTLPALLARLRP
jgi:pyrroline-5-carboxylate reductase